MEGLKKECQHSKTIDNDREGECVCLDCGLVLERLYMSNDNRQSLDCETSLLSIYNFISNVCANGCISENMVLHSFNTLKKVKKQLEKKFKDEVIAAYAIYETLNIFGIPRCASEIHFFSGVSIKQIWKVERCLIITKSLNDPTQYVDRYCSELDGLVYFDNNIIKGIVGNMYGMGGVKSNCLVAVVIYLYCKEKERKISLKKICKICKISTTSVHRVIRNIDVKYVKQITLLYSK
jgi:transcription initiation factor TFIIIB Brf1 subunit/transcription initiation factor TFIIB